MNAYLEIIRPGNAIMAVIAVLLVAIISGIFTLNVLLACTVVFIITGAGNSINDYFDHKIDAINKPYRPIPSGRISLNSGRNLLPDITFRWNNFSFYHWINSRNNSSFNFTFNGILCIQSKKKIFNRKSSDFIFNWINICFWRCDCR